MVAGLFALVAVCFGVVVVGQFAVATVMFLFPLN